MPDTIGLMFRQDYHQFSVFAQLGDDQINQLSPFMAECQFPKDCVIFEQGLPADHLFILVSGEVMIRYKPYDGPALSVARIEPGGVFGWSAAIGRDIYTSGAIALQDSAAYRLRGCDLAAICAEYPETGKILLDSLASVIAERLQSTHTQILGILSQGISSNMNGTRRKTRNDRK